MPEKPTYEQLEKKVEELESTGRHTELLFRRIIDLVPCGIIIKDRNGKFILVNSKAADLYGAQADDMIGRYEYAFARIPSPSPDEIDAFLADDRAVIDSGTPRIISKGKFPFSHGKTHSIHVSKIPITAFGYENCLLIIAADIADHRCSNETTGGHETFLGTLLNAIPIPVFYKDKDGRYLGFNETFEKFFGRTRDELIGKNVFDINPPDLAKIYNAKDKELLENRGVQHYESQVRNAKGSLRDTIFHKSTFTDTTGTVRGLIGAVIDITDRKRDQRRLRESEEKFKAIFDNAMDGILVGDVNTKKFVMANRTICEMTGYAINEILTLSVTDIHPEADMPFVLETFERQRRKEFRVAENLPVRRKDGTVFYADISSSPITIGTGRFMVGIFRDITDRQQAEHQREALISDLKKALGKVKQLSGFLPICSHCKKIRDDKGYWNQIESYIQKHSDAEFSHSICVECAEK
jgi:PAS domain S-box-containing protein